MCEVLAAAAAFICGIVTIFAGLRGLDIFDCSALPILKTAWIKKTLYISILVIGIYGVVVVFYQCPLPIHIF